MDRAGVSVGVSMVAEVMEVRGAREPSGAQRSSEPRAGHRGAVDVLARRLSLRLRAAAPDDFVAIRAIAQTSYPVPDWLFSMPENTAHYDPAFRRSAPAGEVHVCVAELQAVPGALVGYVYVQLRHNGDCYLRDLAARPPAPLSALRGTGTLLVAAAMATALEAGCRSRATLNVLMDHRGDRPLPDPPGRWRDPVGFYRRLGYRVRPQARGYSVFTPERPRTDTWMSASPEEVYRRSIGVLAALLSEAGIPPDSGLTESRSRGY